MFPLRNLRVDLNSGSENKQNRLKEKHKKEQFRVLARRRCHCWLATTAPDSGEPMNIIGKFMGL